LTNVFHENSNPGLEPHDVQTVPEAGFAGKKNGELLGLAEGKYDVFITLDKGLSSSRIWQVERLLRDYPLQIKSSGRYSTARFGLSCGYTINPTWTVIAN
jgi:hypothetical protein